MDPLHTLILYFLAVSFNMILHLLHPGFPSCLIPAGLRLKIPHQCLFSPVRVTCRIHLSSYKCLSEQYPDDRVVILTSS